MSAQPSRETEQRRLTEAMGITAAERASRRAFVNLTDDDIALLRELRPVMEAEAERIVDHFYRHIEHHPELMAIIRRAGSTIDRLKQTQRRYLTELFAGQYDEAYFEGRLQIGVIHHQIGLTPRWYLGAYTIYSQLINEIIFRRYMFRPSKAGKAISAVQKVLSIDSQLAIDTYIHGLMDDYKSVSMSRDDIEKRVREYSELIEQVARGDLTRRIEVRGDDELARLGHHLNMMTDSLAAMTGRVTESSDAILGILEQVQQAVNDQSSGAAQQASSVNQTTSTLEEIRSTSRQTLEKALALGEVAERTRQEGEHGLNSVEGTVMGMRKISTRVDAIAQTVLALSDQVQQIGEITTVVNGLAQQSKMLALNASIEAAKAGEAGRGFAVVAAEVKELAEQSQQSTSQVQSMLQEIRKAADRAVMTMEESSKGLESGAQLAERTGATMENLINVIHETSLASQQIVAAVRQEAAGIDQIATGSSELSHFAAELQNLVGQFKVVDGRHELTLAKAAHHAWIVRVRAFLDGREFITPEQVTSERHCDLGRWYYGEGKERYGHLPEMGELEAPHSELHRLMREVIELKSANRTEEAEAAFKRVEELSRIVTEILTRLERQAN